MNRTLRLELILGTLVLTRDGRKVGRIEEVLMGERSEITHFLTGQRGLVERMSAIGLFHWKAKGYRIRWDQIDWSDQKHPRLTCSLDELEPL